MNFKSITIAASLTVASGLTSLCSFAQSPSKFIREGFWRGTFLLNNSKKVPFNFEVKGKTAADAKVYLINGKERFEINRLKQVKDSLFIYLDQFDNELALKIGNNSLEGVLRKQNGSGATPVSAEFGKKYRFDEPKEKPAANLTGTYEVVFKDQSGKETKSVGLFSQNGAKLSGTFLKSTGDSRFLDGVVDGNKFYLSTFIGSGVGYYEGTILANGAISGLVGVSGKQTFSGTRNEQATLADAYSLTYLKDGYKTLDFSFPDLNGKKVSLKDEKYKGKVVILTITGSWCPNCMDEASFLAPWFKKNKSRGIEAIGLHYERTTESAYVKKVLSRFKDRFDIEYDQVIAGTADPKSVSESLPALNSFLSFPTTIFIDKKGNVAKIYTGYNGPATGKYYAEYVKEFNAEIDKLVAE